MASTSARDEYTRLNTTLPVDSDGDGSSLEPNAKGGQVSVMQETLVQPVFNLKVFTVQLLLNMFEPLSSLVAMASFGCHKATVMGLVPGSSCNMFIELHHWDPVMACLSVGLYIAYRPSFDEGSVLMQEVVLWPLVCMFVQKIMVAYKYAMLTPEEYAEFLEAPLEVAGRWNQHLQLISGWMPLPNDLLLSELRIAAKHVGRDIAQRGFVYSVTDDASLASWQTMNAIITNNDSNEGLGEQLGYKLLQSTEQCQQLKAHILQHRTSMGVRRASAQDVFVQLLRIARDGCIVLGARHCFMCTGLLVSVFPAHRVLDHGWQDLRFSDLDSLSQCFSSCLNVIKVALGGGSVPVAIACLLSWRLVIKYNTIVFTFVASAAAHYHRTKLLLFYLALLPRTVQETHPNIPQLQLEFNAEQNLESLLLCFEIAVQYGARYRARLDTFLVTIFFAACLVLAQLYLQIGAAVEADDDLTFLKPTALVWCGNTGVIFGLICATVFAGASANESFSIMSHNIVSRRWKQYYMRRRDTFYKADVDHSNSQHANAEEDKDGDALDLAVERISCLENAEQVRVAGFVASTDLGWAFAGTVYPVILVILGKLFFPQYEVSIV